MTKTQKKVSIISVIVLAMFTVATAGHAADGFHSTIKIGILGPGSGNYAWVKDYFSDAVTLAADEINAQNGAASAGVRLEWIFEDDMGDPTQSVTSTIRLIERERVDVIFGPFNSSCALAQIGVVEEAQVPQILWALNDTITEQGNQWIFRNSPSDIITVTSVMDHVIQEGLTKIAFLTDTTDYGTSGYLVGEPYLRALNLAPLTNEKFNIPDTDFTAQLMRINSTEPDVIMLHGDEANCGLIARQRLQLGMGNIPLIGTIPLTGVKFLENAGAEGSEGCIVATNFIATREEPRTQDFVRRFTERFGYVPEGRCAALYDATYVLAEALKNSGGSIEKAAVRDGIRAVQGFQGLQGTFSFDEKGNALSSSIKGIFTDGELVFLSE